MYTPEILTYLKSNEIFVFGTNQFGRHEGGAAKTAINKFGAVYDIPIGLCGQSYGIITTSFNNNSISFEFIMNQIKILYDFARLRSDLTFFVTKIGCGIAGFSIEAIATIFKEVAKEGIPVNIVLPIEFV